MMSNSRVQTFSVGTCANPALGGRELRAWPCWSSLVMIVLHPEEESAHANEEKKWAPWSSVDRGKTMPHQVECPQHTVLSMKDTALFGGTPESDRLVTSTCLFCPAVRRLEFIAQHMLEAHPEECKRKLRKPQKGHPHSEGELSCSLESEAVPGPSKGASNLHIECQDFSDSETGASNVCVGFSNGISDNSEEPELEEQQCNISYCKGIDLLSRPARISEVVRPNSKSARKRRFSLEKNREYDPDEHCGVLTEPNGKPCCYALSACKLHPVMQRRAVHGRRATYDELVSNCRRRI